MKQQTMSQVLAWLHLRTVALEAIYSRTKDAKTARIAGGALTCGPNAGTVCELANAAMMTAQQEGHAMPS